MASTNSSREMCPLPSWSNTLKVSDSSRISPWVRIGERVRMAVRMGVRVVERVRMAVRMAVRVRIAMRVRMAVRGLGWQ